MFRAHSEERARSHLSQRPLETNSPELRHALAYALHLRSHWKPEGQTKLVVPASWMEYLPAFVDDGNLKCVGVACRGAVERHCPFRDVRFESAAETRPDEELPQDIVSCLLTNIETDPCLATLVPRAFQGIPHTKLRGDIPTASHSLQSTPWRIDLASVPERERGAAENTISESSTQCLIIGIKELNRTASFDSQSGQLASVSIPEELTRCGRVHLIRLASSTRGIAVKTAGPCPEWLVLFGLIYDTRHVRIVAYVPHPRKSDRVGCATCIVDELAFHSGTCATTCELVLERLRLLSALTVLRRHVHHLSKSLFTATGPHQGRSSLSGCSACDHDSDSFKLCASSEYSTCASSVHSSNGISCGEGLFSSCSSLCSSSCSACSNVLESTSDLVSIYSEDCDYIEPPTHSLSQGDKKTYKISETRRREIIVWAQQVIPTEHPVKDNYRMVISQGPRTLHGTRR